MPIYEYSCKQCGHTFEKLVSRSRMKDAQQCPDCGAVEADKLVSSFSSKVAGSAGRAISAPSGGGGGFS